MSTTTCSRCGKPAHPKGTPCKAPFSRSWKGQPAMRFLIRGASGGYLEIETDLTEEQYKRGHAFLHRVLVEQRTGIEKKRAARKGEARR